METPVAWLGYLSNRYKYASIALEEDGIHVEGFFELSKGLKALVEKEFPLVIIPDWFDSRVDIEFPERIDIEDLTGITCHVIERIRQLPGYKEIPIIIYSVGKPKSVNRRMRESGATEIYDANSDSVFELPKVIKRYLDAVKA